MLPLVKAGESRQQPEREAVLAGSCPHASGAEKKIKRISLFIFGSCTFSTQGCVSVCLSACSRGAGKPLFYNCCVSGTGTFAFSSSLLFIYFFFFSFLTLLGYLLGICSETDSRGV